MQTVKNKNIHEMSDQELQSLGFLKQETILRETNDVNLIRQELHQRHQQKNGHAEKNQSKEELKTLARQKN